MLLRDKRGHLFLNGGHLFIKLRQSPHEMTIAVNFCGEGAVFYAGYGSVHLCELVPSRKEFFQILDRIQCSVVEAGFCVDLPCICRTIRRKFPERVRVGCHEHHHIFGGNSVSAFVRDAERNVIMLVILLVSFRDQRLTLLDPYTPLIPGVIQPGRAVFSFSHTIPTSASPSSSATWAHPLGILATAWYFLGIFTIFLIWVMVFFVGVVCFGVGDDVRSERRALRLPSCGNSGFSRNFCMDLPSMFCWNEVKLVVVFIMVIFRWEVG